MVAAARGSFVVESNTPLVNIAGGGGGGYNGTGGDDGNVLTHGRVNGRPTELLPGGPRRRRRRLPTRIHLL